MNPRILKLIALFLAWSGADAGADPHQTSNHKAPFPPSCITVPLRELDLAADNAKLFFSDRIWLEAAHKIESGNPYDNLGEVQLDMYRLGCAEPGRSVVIAEFTLPPEWVDPRRSQLVLPWLTGSTPMDPFPLQFKPEANAWGQSASQYFHTKQTFGDYTGGWDDARRFSWRYVLDVHPQDFSDGWDGTANYYNGRFGLLFERSDNSQFLTIDVPATADLFEPSGSLPLSGRLSGNWVEPGANDQGLLISFSHALPPSGTDSRDAMDSDLVIFLSWFTFDRDGEMLWLTGAARFPQGASEVVIPIERVEQGTFLGNTLAERSVVGNATLRAIGCNLLELDFELDSLGLGADVMQLQRLFALEISDHPCRDRDARYDSLYAPDIH